MRHATAVRRLRTIAERCEDLHRFGNLWLLTGVYAFGAVVDARGDLDGIELVLEFDLPPEELAWGTRPPRCSNVAHLLDLHKSPIDWYCRPAAWPVSNHVIRRPLRIWSPEGPDTTALEALRAGNAEALRLPEPDAASAEAQLRVELAASLAHLQRVEESYWEKDWRRDHRGDGIYPEDHLWRAVHGCLDLQRATEN